MSNAILAEDISCNQYIVVGDNRIKVEHVFLNRKEEVVVECSSGEPGARDVCLILPQWFPIRVSS